MFTTTGLLKLLFSLFKNFAIFLQSILFVDSSPERSCPHKDEASSRQPNRCIMVLPARAGGTPGSRASSPGPDQRVSTPSPPSFHEQRTLWVPEKDTERGLLWPGQQGPWSMQLRSHLRVAAESRTQHEAGLQTSVYIQLFHQTSYKT